MKEKEEQKKNDQITVNVTSGAFPLKLWKEWDADCKENFGDCRWMKMWHDHLIAKSHKTLITLLNFEPEEDVTESNKEEESKTVKTLKGELEVKKDE